MKPSCSPQARRDIAAIALTTIVAFLLAGRYDALEYLVEISRRYERFEIDEIITALAVLALCLIAFSMRRMKELAADRRKLKDINQALHASLAEIKTLQGIIPICSHCKQIRDDAGAWQQVEAYVQSRSQARFSHGICPQCAKKHYSDLDES